MNVNDGLEYIMWIRGLGGEGLPAAPYALHLNLKNIYILLSERIETFIVYFLHYSSTMCLIICLAGAPNERASFRFHDAVVDFVNRCSTSTRNLAASN